VSEPATRLRLSAVQAEFGDCLLVEARSGAVTRHLLIDGGPPGTYESRLRPLLVGIAAAGGRIDVAVVSHIDIDHITGILDLFGELKTGPPAGAVGHLPPIDVLWHNSFALAVGGAELEPIVREVLRSAPGREAAMPALAMVLRGVGEGDALRTAALALGIGSDPFLDSQVLVDRRPPIRLGDLKITVVGPSRAILDRLKVRWLAWLEAHHPGVAESGPAAGPAAAAAAVAADGSLPNLSSIVLLVELGARSLLLTGDARSDEILAGMREAGVLDADGRRHVSILKMPHHGSIRNVTAEFLQAVTADCYVISANGRYGNPDYEALVLTVETAHAQGRPFELALTNVTPSSERLLTTHPPATFGYQLRLLQADAPALELDARPWRAARAESWTG
jgi:hypothetical protein